MESLVIAIEQVVALGEWLEERTTGKVNGIKQKVRT